MTEELIKKETAVAPRQPINIDLSAGIVPKSYNEALQMAALLHGSGLAPKSLDTVQKCAVAMFMCIELGRPIMTGVQDIAVINGKAGIFGDAALAIVRASGLLEKFKEWETGTPYTDDWTFYCEVKRKGMSDIRKGVWSWVDSQRAGFDNPTMKGGGKDIYSPWTRFTRRMMQFKARNFPLRDEFGDVLKGMRLSEDNMDAIDMYPDDTTGSYERQEAPKATVGDEAPKTETAPDIQAKDEFKEFIAGTDLPPNMVDRFVKETAEVNKISVDVVRAEVLKDKDAFKLAAKKWIRTQQEEVPAEEVTLFDELKAMRPKSSAKNMAIFRDRILDNIEEIREWPENDWDYITLKWNNTFPDESFLDLVNPPEEQEEDRPPEPPNMFGDESPKEAGAATDNESAHVPPWARRKRFLDSMKDCYGKNRTVYFNTLGAQGYESANDVPEDADQEAMILSIIQSEIPG